MKDVSTRNIRSIVLALLVLGLFSAAPAYCQEEGHALLLQQTPSQGGTVSPEIGVHHFGSELEVTLVAVPKPGYNFIYWLGDVLDPTASKTTAILDEPKIIIAVFQQIEEGQVIVGQNTARTAVGGGGGSFSSSGSSGGSSGGGKGGGRRPPGSDPSPPGEGDDNDPPDDPPIDPPIDPPDDPFDPPDPPIDPPDDPPNVPEPATCLMLGLGGLALLRKRRA